MCQQLTTRYDEVTDNDSEYKWSKSLNELESVLATHQACNQDFILYSTTKKFDYTPDELQEPTLGSLRLFDHLYSESLSVTSSYRVVNCWHINEGESEEMWKEYVPDGNGVVIKTTFKRLCASFNNTTSKLYYSNGREIPVHAGMMRYINRDQQWISYEPFSWNVFYKKKLENSHRAGIESCDRFISSKPFWFAA